MNESCPLCSRALASAAAKGCGTCGWAREIPEHVLSPDQQAAWDLLQSTENVFLTGPAGCVDGEALIPFNRAGIGRKIKLKDMYLKFHGLPGYGGKPWRKDIPTFVRSAVDGFMRLHLVKDVLDQGVKDVVKIKTASGKTLRVTPDHEVCVGADVFARADALQVGDTIYTNGSPVCVGCKKKGDIVPAFKGPAPKTSRGKGVTNKYAGYCRDCVKQILREDSAPDFPTPAKGGYLCWTVPRHPSRKNSQNKRVLEHRLVVEACMNGATLREWLDEGRSKEGYRASRVFLRKDQVVHHDNEDRRDNRRENLVVTDQPWHAKHHGEGGVFLNMEGGRGGKGGLVQFVPKPDVILSVEPDGEAHVYDIVCDDPWRNFVANGIVVHNCGKTYLIERWLREGSAKDQNVAILASTGIAATHIGGRTVHSWSGMGFGKESAERIADDPRFGWRFRIAPRIRGTDVLLVDEISMINGRTLALLSDLCRIARGPKGAITAKQRVLGELRGKHPFGKIKVVFVGDMGQLAPVEEETGFPFETSEWWDARIRTAELTTVHRQAEAPYVAVLSQVRLGSLDEAGRALLESRVNAFDPDEDPPAVRVATHNVQVDAVNQARLTELPGPLACFDAIEAGDQKGLDQIDKHCLSPRLLALKVGARVMFTRNEPSSAGFEGRFVNGTLGTVTWIQGAEGPGHSATEGGFEVTTDDGLVICPEQYAWHHGTDSGDIYVPDKWTKKLVKKREPAKGEACRVQYPIRLAWALTVHKTQGMTLSRVSLDLGDCFAPGQAYVALSRARSLEGLNIERWNGPASVFAHPTAVAFIRGEYRPPVDYVPAAPVEAPPATPVPQAPPAVVPPVQGADW